jgi:rfaE bifunctional protein nucleotidyltransferase chain/domain
MMVMNLKTALPQIQEWQIQDLKVVLVTGVFDILHVEHLRFLKKAKESGDKLVVGIESDSRVKKIKGDQRPIYNQQIRLEQLNALKVVDLTFVLPEEFDTQKDWEQLMKKIQPQIYAVSSHTSFLDNKRKISEKYGATLLVVHQFNPRFSSSQIIYKMKA